MKVLCSLLPLAALVSAPLAYSQTTYSYVSVDYPGAGNTVLSGVNSSGEAVGTYSDSPAGTVSYSFLRSASGSYTPLLAGTPSFAAGISDSGIIVGSAKHSGFIISKGTVTPVTSAKFATYLSGISSKNQIVGYFFDGLQEYYGFQTSGGKLVELPYYESLPVRPQAINAAGTVVGFPEALSQDSFILPAGGTYQIVQYPGAIFGTELSAINDAGIVAGLEASTSSGYGQGFTYDGATYSAVVYPGSIETQPLGINNSGVVVGFYFDAGLVTHGFIATPIP